MRLVFLVFFVCIRECRSELPQFVSYCSPFKDTSCSISCQTFQCMEPSCGLKQDDHDLICEQNLRIRNPTLTPDGLTELNFVELESPNSVSGAIAATLKFELPSAEIANLTNVFLEVGIVGATATQHFVVFFSHMKISDSELFHEEVVVEFPVRDIRRGDSVHVQYSSNICGTVKAEVLTVPYILVPQSLSTEYPQCPKVQFDYTEGLLRPVQPSKANRTGQSTSLPLQNNKTDGRVSEAKRVSYRVRWEILVAPSTVLTIALILIVCLLVWFGVQSYMESSTNKDRRDTRIPLGRDGVVIATESRPLNSITAV